MQSDNGKLFIGGISWDTNEERLKENFSSFGEVTEAVILKDRTTGRASGFGFVVFADPVVAEIVITEKHNIDGRLFFWAACLAPLVEVWEAEVGAVVGIINLYFVSSGCFFFAIVVCSVLGPIQIRDVMGVLQTITAT